MFATATTSCNAFLGTVSRSGYFLPPKSMITDSFLKAVLAGDKKLLKSRDIKFNGHIPRYAELHVPSLWDEVKRLPTVHPYFPDSFVKLKRVPNRDFLFTVWSTGPRERRERKVSAHDRASQGSKRATKRFGRRNCGASSSDKPHDRKSGHHAKASDQKPINPRPCTSSKSEFYRGSRTSGPKPSANC